MKIFWITCVLIICLWQVDCLKAFQWPLFMDSKNSINPLKDFKRFRSEAMRKLGQGIYNIRDKVNNFGNSIFNKGGETNKKHNMPYSQGTSNVPSIFNKGILKVSRPMDIPTYNAQGYGRPNSQKFFSNSAMQAKGTMSNYIEGKNSVNQSSYSSVNPAGSFGHSSESSYHLFKSNSKMKPDTHNHKVNTHLPATTMPNLSGKEQEKSRMDTVAKWKPVNFMNGEVISKTPSTRGGKVMRVSFKNTNNYHKKKDSLDTKENEISFNENNSDRGTPQVDKLPLNLFKANPELLKYENKMEGCTPKHEEKNKERDANNSSVIVSKSASFGTSENNSNKLQENLSIVKKEINSRPSVRIEPGQKSNMVLGRLLEELGLTILKTFIRRTNLEAMLTTEGGFTIFAPSDSSFKHLPVSVFRQLEQDTEKLREVILFHVAPGKVRLEDVRHEMVLASASPGARMLRLNIYEFGSDLQPIVTVNGARIKLPNILGSNVVVHVIDRVMFPMANQSILEHLSSCNVLRGANVAISSSQLGPTLNQEGPFTLFVPSTDAFGLIDNTTVSKFVSNITFLRDVMLLHLVPGTYYSEGLRDGAWLPTSFQNTEIQVQVSSDGITKRLTGVNGRVRVIKSDIPATNGVIHVIDTVMQPGMASFCGQV